MLWNFSRDEVAVWCEMRHGKIGSLQNRSSPRRKDYAWRKRGNYRGVRFEMYHGNAFPKNKGGCELVVRNCRISPDAGHSAETSNQALGPEHSSVKMLGLLYPFLWRVPFLCITLVSSKVAVFRIISSLKARKGARIGSGYTRTMGTKAEGGGAGSYSQPKSSMGPQLHCA